MKLNNLLQNCGFLYRVVRKSTQPADQILSEYFRKKKNIGSKERKFISEVVFSLLRNELSINYLITNYFSISKGFNLEFSKKHIFLDNDITEQLKLLFTFIFLNITSRKFVYLDILTMLSKVSFLYTNKDLILEELLHCFNLNDINLELQNLVSDFENKYEKIDHNSNHDFSNIQNYHSFPEFLINNLSRYLSYNQLITLSKSLNFSALPNIRINNKFNLDSVIDELNSNSIPFEISNYLPLAIILNKRVNLNEFNFFKKGLVEVQDIGSQLISYALNPSLGSKILDSCAGAGGKSLHIASITNDSSEIIANDAEFSRMKELNSRARRAGFNSITIKNLNKFNVFNEYKDYFDYILIDAPCSGLGTARRSPLLKYRLNQKMLEKLNNTQLEIINYYSKLLRPGGILVYATCSFLPQENLEIVNKFLNQNTNFSPDPLYPVFLKNSINIPDLNSEAFDLTLYPHIHGTDGFYMARLQKQ